MNRDQYPEQKPEIKAAERWFDEMQRRYPEPRPASEDPEEIQA